VEPGRELRLASELPDADAQLRERVLGCVARVLGIGEQVRGKTLNAWRVALAKRSEGLPVTVLRSLHQDRVAQLLVDERPGGPQLDLLTPRAAERLHAPSLVAVSG
jgi:hypothetical protein